MRPSSRALPDRPLSRHCIHLRGISEPSSLARRRVFIVFTFNSGTSATGVRATAHFGRPVEAEVLLTRSKSRAILLANVWAHYPPTHRLGPRRQRQASTILETPDVVCYKGCCLGFRSWETLY